MSNTLREATARLIRATGSRKGARKVIKQLAEEVKAGAHDGAIGMYVAKKQNKSEKLS